MPDSFSSRSAAAERAAVGDGDAVVMAFPPVMAVKMRTVVAGDLPVGADPAAGRPGRVSRAAWPPAAAASRVTAAARRAGPARSPGTWMVIWSSSTVRDRPGMPACSMNAAAARSAWAWAASGRAGSSPPAVVAAVIGVTSAAVPAG